MKPFIAQGAEACLEGGSWLEPYWPRLVAIVTSRERTHFDERFGLFLWDDAMQSGADNNPAITNEPTLRSQILAVDVNAYMVREYRALAFIARRLGYDGMAFEHRAQDLCSAIETHLWHGDDGTYWNLNRKTGIPLRCVNWSMATLLWAEAALLDRGKTMAARYILSEDHLSSPFGLRSLSSQDPRYNNRKIIWPHSNWQGPIWVVASYIAFSGLRKYGFRSEANALAERLEPIVLADLEAIGSMHENYCAETGAPLAPSSETSPDGTEGGFIGWNLLLQDMLEGLA
jgi:alpha,alpha-trehalase